MDGMAGDIASADEASEHLITKTDTTDTAAGHVHESASHAREKIANQLQPGDTMATSRRMSDIPDSVWQLREDNVREVPDLGVEKSKPLLQYAQETVAKALGGGSRGAD
ncbi:hypothetical protein N7499_001369 [Penicillium canescens]|uniref:Uncharacterized protein n=1 Tax=Penicillium canescens TaxID=5083 RepID=A0AAD6N472_PENCN|nr:uncharacterized protein N7446_003489 [Penicillium canescens]KAJ6027910.1 hypothetical protein N7460_012727 [Penicillium canescens]KAJ6041194.1 hypothetical protein N7444_010099 [Penicillium canescens]KAJ6066452.1 hypothetical protein N7446_003489 [Penicillium canescens]KAJ6101739.1 hypothetical protein N7499_001369 [Penicillium canescens]KAJ6174204.1 hypothetical protein N7485_007016 [Penicillium canescens]